jgi:hypothetical protein
MLGCRCSCATGEGAWAFEGNGAPSPRDVARSSYSWASLRSSSAAAGVHAVLACRRHRPGACPRGSQRKWIDDKVQQGRGLSSSACCVDRGVGRQEYPVRPKIAMWSDYGSPTKRRRSPYRRRTRPSIGLRVLLAAVVLVASVIGISGIYPQIIDSQWARGTSVHSQGIVHPETTPETVGMTLSRQPRTPARPGWVAQLIGDSSEAAALFRFRQMQGRLQSALAGFEPVILRTTIKTNEAPIWVRVRIEFDARQSAESLCSKLEAAGETCLVQRNSER